MHIQPTVNTRMVVEDSETKAVSVGSASGSAANALQNRVMMQLMHSTAAAVIAIVSLLIQVGC